jgi:hypothetical protein
MVCGLRETVTAAGAFAGEVALPPQSSMNAALTRIMVAANPPANLICLPNVKL